MIHAKTLTGAKRPLVFVDSGTENLNSDVDKLIELEMIDRIVAGIEVDFSNSMVEALFSSAQTRISLHAEPNFLQHSGLENKLLPRRAQQSYSA